MNDFIDLPHLPECLLGLPLETIHEIHSHTYHAIKADRQNRGAPVAVVDGDETGTWAEFVPGCDLVPGQELYTTPQPAESHVDRASRIVDSWPEWKRNYALTKHDVKATHPAAPALEPSDDEILSLATTMETHGDEWADAEYRFKSRDVLGFSKALLTRYGSKL